MVHRRIHSRTSVLALPVLLVVASCASVKGFLPSSADGSANFVHVDELLGRVERVHVDCELAGRSVEEAMVTLRAMVAPDFRGDPAEAHAALVAALEMSIRQEEDLRNEYRRMKQNAEEVFSNWETNLGSFSSETMRAHSTQRMEAMRARYDAVETAVGPQLEAYDAFHDALNDHALYLGTDFNEESVHLVEHELRQLFAESKRLRAGFEECTDACREYVRKSALRGQVAPSGREV